MHRINIHQITNEKKKKERPTTKNERIKSVRQRNILKNSYYFYLPYILRAFHRAAWNCWMIQCTKWDFIPFYFNCHFILVSKVRTECDIDLIKTKNLLRLVILSAMQISGFNCSLMNGCLCQKAMTVDAANNKFL